MSGPMAPPAKPGDRKVVIVISRDIFGDIPRPSFGRSFWWMTNPLDFGPGRFERSDGRRLGFAICVEGEAPTL
jgi:hypothetical protein